MENYLKLICMKKHTDHTEHTGRLAAAAKPARRDCHLLCVPVNPNTVQKALTELERGGLIYSQRTAGHFVTEDPETIAAARRDLASAQTDQYLRGMRELGFTPAQTAEITVKHKTNFKIFICLPLHALPQT